MITIIYHGHDYDLISDGALEGRKLPEKQDVSMNVSIK